MKVLHRLDYLWQAEVQRMVGYPLAFDDGSLTTRGKVVTGRYVGPYFVADPLPSAKVARDRLRRIVRQDREDCPAWRWVAVKRPAPPIFLCAAVAQWTVRGYRGDRLCQHLASSFVRSWRRRFRWEQRR